MNRIALAAAVLAAAAAAIGLFMTERVPGGSVAVRLDGSGAPAAEWGPGIHLRLPGSGPVLVYPAEPETLRFPSATAPGYRLFDRADRPLDVDFEVLYRAVPGRARALADAVGAGFPDTLVARLRRHARDLAARLDADDPSTPAALALSLEAELDLPGAAVSLAAVSAGRERESGSGVEVLLVGIDAGDWKVIDPLLEEGKLPHLRGLLAKGARLDLNSMQPMLSPLLWTTVATGTTPDRHGILDFMTVDSETGDRIPTTRRQRREPAFWNALTQLGIEQAVIGWLATWPAETVSGHLVTDRFGYLAFAESVGGTEDAGMTWPPDYVREARALEVPVGDLPLSYWRRFVTAPDSDLRALAHAEGFDRDDRLGNLALTLTAALTTTRIAEDVQERFSPRVVAVYYEMIDAVGHLAMPYAPPRRPGIDEAGFERYRRTMDAAYELQDELLGRLLERTSENTVVILVSDHGFRSGEDRPAGSAEIHGGEAARWHREPGILLLAGPGIRAGVRIEAPVELIDVAPTLHALLGVPIPRSMTGRVLEEVFTPEGAARHVPNRVETVAWRPEVWTPPAEPEAGEGGPAAAASRHNNLGLVLQENGRLAEAEAEFRKALEAVPRDRLARTNLAGILLTTGRLDEARGILERVVADFPDNVPALFNLGVVYQRTGRIPDAARLFETALAQDPAHGKARIHLGEVYLRQRRTEDAARVFGEALARDPDEPRAYFGMGLVHVQRNDLAAAAAAFRRVLALDPGHESAAANLDAVERALSEN